MLHHLKQWLAPPHFVNQSQNRIARWLNIYLLGGILFGLILSPLSQFSSGDADSTRLGLILLLGSIGHLVAWITLKREHIQPAVLILFFTLLGMVTLALSMFNGIRDTGILGFSLILAVVSLFSTTRVTIFVTGVCLLTAIAIYYLETIGWATTPLL